MKKTFLYSVLLCVLYIPVFGQDWNAVNLPIDENINGISFVNQDTVYLVTNQGKLLRSFDGLSSFDIFDPLPGVSLEDVHFVNSSLGFICGPKGICMKTTDGGYSFESLNLTDTLPWFFDVEMFDDKHGMVIGMTRELASPLNGLAFRTDDGGKSWTKVKSLGLGYSEIQFHSGLVYLLSFGRINISSDFGKSWKSTNTIEGPPGRSLSFFGSTGVIAGLQGMCGYSLDQGKTWLPSTQDEQVMYIATQMVSPTDGYIGGTNSTLLKTTDGGKSWKAELMAKSFNIFDMAYIDNKVFVVGSEGGVIWKAVK